MSRRIAEGKAIGSQYEIRVRTGTVNGTETRSETEVTGSISGGGGYASGGTGYTAPVSGSVQSKTTRYQTMFLTDEEGREHTVELVDFLVPCKEGHKLSLFLLMTGGANVGSYFRAYNHNTGQHYEHTKAVRSEMFPWKIFTALTALLAVWIFFIGISEDGNGFGEVLFITVIVTAIGGGLLWVVGAVLAFIRSLGVRGNPAYKSYLAGLGAKSAGNERLGDAIKTG